MNKIFVILLVLILLYLGTARPFGNSIRETPKVSKSNGFKSTQSSVPYQEKYFEVDIDHFNFHSGGSSSKTFQMRYLINSDSWDQANAGPILFYCGNEGSITEFWENTGFQTITLAQEFKGLVVFAEHRYFGKSLPFGNNSLTKENLVYLTTEQALADFAVFLRAFKSTIIACEDCPVIAFGGSYGGMLAAWMRMKFPNIVDGAIAASAPVIFFNGVTPLEAFSQIVTDDFKLTSTPKCSSIIAEGMKRLDKLIADVSLADFALINKVTNPCEKIKDAAGISTLEDWFSNAYVYMAMVNYPYETEFLTHMPGNPVNFACQAFVGLDINASDEQILTAMVKAANIYYDYDNTTTCNQVNSSDSAGNIDGAGWNILACSEMVLPMESYGPNEEDMFPKRPWDYDAYSAFCDSTYTLQARYTWALDFFGGWNYEKDYKGYSNIFFSNGKLDPWSAGGVLKNVSKTVKAYNIEGAAHHLDLRLPHPADPADVNIAREMEKAEIREWIMQKKVKNFSTEMLRAKTIINSI